MEQHPLPDQIAADRYLETKKAARKKGWGSAEEARASGNGLKWNDVRLAQKHPRP